MKLFEENHNQLDSPLIRKARQAQIKVNEVSDIEIVIMMRNIKMGKALGLDGVSDSLFKLEHHWENNPIIYERNQKKIKFCRSILNNTYLNSKEALKHFKCRLIPLNKKHPNIPLVTEFRPIVGCSPVFKFLEGLFTMKLRRYMSNRLCKEQKGFVPGQSI